MKKLCIYAASDRFNYGDLLFPLILSEMLKPATDRVFQIEVVGTVKSDLRVSGGLKTTPVKNLFSPAWFPPGSVVIVGGGEVLPPSWHEVMGCTDSRLSKIAQLCERALMKVRFPAWRWTMLTDRVFRWLVCPKLEYPFLLSEGHFPSGIKVIYNTIGCIGLENLGDNAAIFRERLNGATFISVRDKASADALRKLGFHSGRVRLAPDSAIVISDLYDRRLILNSCEKPIQAFIKDNEYRYVCFQISLQHAKDDISALALQLNQIAKTHDARILLLPIGYARHHWDQHALALIREALTVESVMPEAPSAMNIMAAIAFCKVFIGTSLHGAITALSYAVPHVSIGPSGGKLESFIRTWDLPEQSQCTPINGLAEKVNQVLCVSSERRIKKKEALIKCYRKCFDEILSEITA